MSGDDRCEIDERRRPVANYRCLGCGVGIPFLLHFEPVRGYVIACVWCIARLTKEHAEVGATRMDA